MKNLTLTSLHFQSGLSGTQNWCILSNLIQMLGNPCSMVIKPQDGQWTMDHLEHWIDFTQTTGRAFCECRALRRHRSPTLATHPTLIFGCCVSLQMGPATLRGYCRLSLWLLCCLFFPTGHILIFGIVERKWMKETDPSSDITWQWKIKPWRWFLQKPPIPHAAWPSLRFSWWRLCV